MVAVSFGVIGAALRGRSPLWRQPDFLRLWAAQSVSEVGDAITRLALCLVAISLLDATPFEVGVLGAAQFLPFVLVGLPTGAVVDRLAHKRRVLVLADVGRALCIGTVRWPTRWAR